MGRCVEVTQALRQRQARGEKRILGAKNLRHAARPADALTDVSSETLRCQTGCPRKIDVGGVPAAPLQTQGCVGIFRDRLYRDAANLIQRAAPQYGTGSAEEARIPKIVSVLHETVKQFALIRDLAELPEISLERIGGVEVVRRLHKSEIAVTKEPPQRCFQK